MNEFTAAICDDEQMAVDILSSALVSCFKHYEARLTLEKFNTSAELNKKIDSGDCRYDIFFLDIDMPKFDGITLAKKIKSQQPDATIIYVSNREDKVFETFSTQPFGFIRKNNFLEDVNSVVKLFLLSFTDSEGKNPCINFKTLRGIERISIRNIIYIGCIKDYQYVYIYKKQEPLRIKLRMNKLEEMLEKYGFIRIHQGYIVNYRFISKIDSDTIELNDGQTIPVSRRKKQDVMLQYMRLISE